VRLKLLYNPTAGRGRAKRHIDEATAYLRAHGADVDCATSESAAHLSRLAKEASESAYDRVVVCGGDGTLNLAVRELDLERGTLALLPFGSGDDFARVTGVPRDVAGACNVVLRGEAREVDVALANGTRYLGVAGLGFDSEVAKFANERVKFLRGSAVYFYATLRILGRFTPRSVRILTPEGERREEIMFAVVGNSRQYGGGVRIVPDAVIDDGVLDLCIVHKTSRFQLVKTLPLAYSGAHVKSPFVETGRVTEIRFEHQGAPMDVYADGERITETPVQFGLAEKKLKFVMP
jgi:diacylglycerol kinase (ATP)